MARVRLDRRGIAQLLTSPEMQRAVDRVGQDVAGRVRDALTATRRGYSGLGVSVQTGANGGVRGDRARAQVLVEPPRPEDVVYPDVVKRFGVVKRVAGEVSR